MPLLKDWIQPYSKVIVPASSKRLDPGRKGIVAKSMQYNFFSSVPVRDWEYGWFPSFQENSRYRAHQEYLNSSYMFRHKVKDPMNLGKGRFTLPPDVRLPNPYPRGGE